MNRAELRAQAAAARERVEAALTKNPHVQRARKRRRVVRIATVFVLLLLLLFLRCDDGVPVVAEPVVVDAGTPTAEVVKPKPKPTKPKPVRPVTVASTKVERPDFETPSRLRDAWVDAFRLQVAARSPRLAECFIGASNPGALRWTTLVAPKTGAVGSHEFEALSVGAELNQAQQACLERVLSKPAYALELPTDGLPERVALVLEF